MIIMEKEELNLNLKGLEEKLSSLQDRIEFLVDKANTTNSPAWGSIAHNESDHPNKSDFIIQRGDTWSSWKLPYKYKGSIHCGGTKAASQAVAGARAGKPMQLNAEERTRLNRARRACGIGE